MVKQKNNKNNNKIIPKRDIVFKRLFGSVGSEAILKDLLENNENFRITKRICRL